MSDTVLTPLGERVLVEPDEPITETASGLHIVEGKMPEQTGTVVAVGRAVHPLRDVSSSLAARLDKYALSGETETRGVALRDAAKMLRQLTAYEPSVKTGDRVVFSWASGQELVVNSGETRYLLLRESDLLAVVEP